MERLTYKDEMGYHLNMEFEDADTVTALGRYEDTGLEPEDIERVNHVLGMFADACDGVGLNRIRELCRAEKDGRLVVLPCKVGDTVYVIEPLFYETFGGGDAPCRKCEHFYEGGMGDPPCCLLEDEGCFHIVEETATLRNLGDWLTPNQFTKETAWGKTVFLTHEEAEAALKGGEG